MRTAQALEAAAAREGLRAAKVQLAHAELAAERISRLIGGKS